MKLLRDISKRLSAVKAFLIMGLAVLAVYQAGTLWFENITDGSFFPRNFLTPWRAPAITEDISELARPFRIISGTGDGAFFIEYSNLDTSQAAEYSRGAIAAVLSGGEFEERGALGYEDLLNRPAYIFEYTFSMPPAAFAAAVTQRAAVFTSNNVQPFDSIVIQPPTVEDAGIHLYFLGNGESFHFMLAGQDGLNLHEVFVPRDTGLTYKLTDGNFAAEWLNAAYQPVTVTNPYLHTYGDKLISYIKTCVETFFDNPAAINEASGGADGVLMTFSDANTVVRYYQNDVLEYGDYRVADRNAASSFASDYAAALVFMYADSFIANEFYLAGYKEDNGERTFYFDYAINNFPLTATDGGHAVEVTSERGSVKRYKKLVYNFHIISKDDLTISDMFSYPGGSDSVPLLGYPILPGDNETLALDYIYRY